MQTKKITEKDMEIIKKYLESIRYGSIMINIQDGKIVYIEKNERIRYKDL